MGNLILHFLQNKKKEVTLSLCLQTEQDKILYFFWNIKSLKTNNKLISTEKP